MINSRTDEFKTLTGPTFKLIEKQVFANPWFIKNVPVRERCDYIVERLYKPGMKYYSSDYTSFEALFTPEIMRVVERELYHYMT